MKVAILCGGKGSRFREETEFKPKPMIEIGGMPILWHIMKTYSFYGFSEFILCLGYKGEVIKDYFYNYNIRTNDFTIELKSGNIEIHPRHTDNEWKITLLDTGLEAMTGARVKRIETFIDTDDFMLTYGDGLTDLNLEEVLAFHHGHGKIGTVTGVCPPSRYGELLIRDAHVTSFREKPNNDIDLINGGYFIFKKDIFNYVTDSDSCIFEREPLEKLAREGGLQVFKHRGFWQCMDTYRDFQYLENLWIQEKALWKVW